MLSGRKPRLCIVSPYEHGGGAEYQMNLLIDALAAADRYDIHYLTHFVDARDRTRNYRVSRIGGGPVPRLGYVADGPALYRRLRDIDPGLIYQRVACAYTGICAFYARRRSVPLLWHVAHDTDVTPQPLDRSRNFLRVRLEKWAVEYGIGMQPVSSSRPGTKPNSCKEITTELRTRLSRIFIHPPGRRSTNPDP